MTANKNKRLGLSDAQVIESRKLHGENILTPPAKESLWRQFLDKFSDPLIVILMVVGVLSIGISIYEYFGVDGHDATVFFDPIGIFVAILLATGLSFIFETKADREFTILNKVNDDELYNVWRNGVLTRVPKRDIVVGDIVEINTGDEIAADGVLLDAVSLTCDESSLTGEPSCAKTIDEAHFDKDATYPSNHVLRGTKVLEGHGLMEVTTVGDATEMGKVFEQVQIDNSVKTPLNEQLDRLGKLITNLSYSCATFVIFGRMLHYFNWQLPAWSLILPTAVFFWLVVKFFKKLSKKQCIAIMAAFFAIFIGLVLWLNQMLMPQNSISDLISFTLNTVMIAVTLIVVSVPEGLPMAVTLCLAFSMRRMFKTNNLVRKMHACETMGATTVICTDKTGTLTHNRMSVNSAHFPTIAGDTLDNTTESLILEEGIAVNTTAALDLSDGTPKVIGNPTEGALLLWLRDNGVDFESLKDNAQRLAELPFFTERKFMATIVQSPVTGKCTLYVKGAPEIVLAMCSNIAGNDSPTDIQNLLAEYQAKAMRTLGFAYATLESPDGVIADGKIRADNLTFMGLVAITDPVRDDVPDAVAECTSAGINVKIVTGDTPGTAREIGRRIGLWTDSDTDRNIITGPEFAALSDKELADRVLDLKIIARARPDDKRRLVETLQSKGQVVAVTGDGTNDAPALKAAHVGLSMGDGTSVAKEASDITIIDNSFASIGRAVMWGRSLYKNIQRFLLFQLTVNVAASLLVLMGAFVGTESPLTVTQMLWVNLIMDTFGAMALSSLPPSERVMKDKPRRRTASILTGTMLENIIGVGVFFFLLTLGLMLIFQHSDITSMTDLLHPEFSSNSHSMTPYEMTLLFSVFVWTHFWYMFNARSFESGGSSFNMKNCQGFWLIALIIIIGQILIVEVLYNFFNVTPMRLDDWIIIVVGSSLVVWVREVKHLISKKLSSK